MLMDYVARIVAIACLLFLLGCPICASIVAATKNRDAVGWFFLGLLFGPFGLLAAVGAPQLEDDEARQARRGLSRRKKPCDHCLEPVWYEASVCSHCCSPLVEA